MRVELLRCLRNDRFDRIDLVVSFIMKSGTDHYFELTTSADSLALRPAGNDILAEESTENTA